MGLPFFVRSQPVLIGTDGTQVLNFGPFPAGRGVFVHSMRLSITLQNTAVPSGLTFDAFESGIPVGAASALTGLNRITGSTAGLLLINAATSSQQLYSFDIPVYYEPEESMPYIVVALISTSDDGMQGFLAPLILFNHPRPF